MSMNQTTSTCIDFNSWRHDTGNTICCLLACALLILVGLNWSSAIAATQSEMALADSLPVHEKLGAGREPAKVRWVRRRGYFDGTNGHAGMLAKLKANVQSCIQAAQLGGRQPRPPQVWPEYVQSTQSDTYEAANRTITYSTTLVYTYDQVNCSLVENRQVMAKLVSAKGSCNIDFDNRTAHGVCDARAHAEAPTLTYRGRQTTVSRGSTAADNAQMQAALAAMDKAMKQFGPVKTGERKTIAGIECDVVTHVLGTDGTACIASGESSMGQDGEPGLRRSGVELELSAVGGLNTRAVRAQLEMSVNAAVFAPYLAAGFQVTNITKRK